MIRRLRLALAAGIIAMGVAACGPTGERPQVRLYTEDYSVAISFDPTPPCALEQVQFTIVVRDAKTGEPIEGGEGRIFATNEDRKSTDNGLTPGKELGTYYSSLMFVNAGTWAIGFQFRRDSTQRLQRANDWMQQVLAEAPPGQECNK
ncbi:MAG TPA: hypothetical protein PKC83_03685 [Gemmatimonadaceae bacterium]|jgi:hypothetical protein|nr:MAG: hypothetical protein ABS52_13375 [Gemmatimonadetes bacterium SCN 70-22]HMN07865.1 hypothetical protein [Gemmatimonadaceae bacterium]